MSILARNCSAKGSVAQAMSGASARPTSAEVAMSSELPVLSNPWQADNSQTFVFMVFMGA